MKKQHFNHKRKWLQRTFVTLFAIVLAGSAFLLAINWYVKYTGQSRIYSLENADEIPKTDCILVLGAGLKEDGTPNFMLQDRLDTAIALYRAGVSDRLLVSGDHGQYEYDEVNAMKQYAMASGIPSEAIFMDHAGFSTYESACRANKIFQVKSAIVITQKYHLYRALHDVTAFGIEAFGVCAKDVSYKGQWVRNAREVLARTKDVLWCIVKPAPTYLGEEIPIKGNGNVTNDTASR